ncbi:uncharacterized protein PRCAT00004769001 [Priceomyces carsonii]|uniref:uncharacterized protein n=1 Tax=Priceomyces carsonii TaxID=28549 RepID=UPI002ED98B87|nr:unnamed protein product [Priceomyces carsonii]
MSSLAKSRVQTVSSLKRIVGRGLLKSTANTVLLAYVYIVLPKLFKRIHRDVKGKRYDRIWSDITRTLIKALEFLKFPMSMGRIVAMLNILTPVVEKVLKRRNVANPLLATAIAGFISSMVNYPLFQRHITKYGRIHSLDFTLILVVRALDTVISSSVQSILSKRPKRYNIHLFGDELLFIVSSALIMHAWTFRPEKLPPAYLRWITSAANMDDDIINFFRSFEQKRCKYGEECPDEDIFRDFCKKYGKDPELGDTKSKEPVPCEIYHGFSSKSCELNALVRFVRGFKFAARLYGSINLIMWLVRRGSPKPYIINTVRSSAFLGSFITLMWYVFCMVRSRLSKLFPNVSPNFWERLAPQIGAYATGFSCFVESGQRRKELALFVAPKALGTLVPVKNDNFHFQIENLAFSLSFAILVSYARQDPSKVRGLLGKALRVIFAS